MYKKRWIPIVLAMLALGACSDDNLSDNGNEPQWNAEGKGYVTLALNLPTTSTPGSKAENDDFNDGEASEWAVSDATLLLFMGADEGSATFHSAYKMNLGRWAEETENEQVTASTRITQAINSYESQDGTEAYALVVLNHNGLINITSASNVSIEYESLSGKTWAEVRDIVFETLPTGNGIMMMNAPLTTAKGGTRLSQAPTGTVETLAVIDANKIYKSQAEAEAGDPAATIYVERAVAKVSVNAASNTTGTVGDNTQINYTIDGWLLDITNKSSYFGHNVAGFATWLPYTSAELLPAGTTNYRFAGYTPVETNVAKYRTYWAKDPNYDKDYVDGATTDQDFNKAQEGETFANSTFKAVGTYDYCFENTFNVDNMLDDRSTRVIVRAKLAVPESSKEEDGTFYTEGLNAKTLYNKTGMENIFKSRLMTDPAFLTWVDKNINDKVEAGNITLAFNEEAEKAGQMKLTGVTITGVNLQEGGSATVDPAIVSNITPEVYKYSNGYSYYPVIIKHFGDDLTPWNEPETGSAYGETNREENYLGRYGVVRNNWYDITVSGIARLGYPNVPPAEGEEDDSMQNYISVEINILSWAKRTQEVTLGE